MSLFPTITPEIARRYIRLARRTPNALLGQILSRLGSGSTSVKGHQGVGLPVQLPGPRSLFSSQGSSVVEQEIHNLHVTGSNPVPASNLPSNNEGAHAETGSGENQSGHESARSVKGVVSGQCVRPTNLPAVGSLAGAGRTGDRRATELKAEAEAGSGLPQFTPESGLVTRPTREPKQSSDAKIRAGVISCSVSRATGRRDGQPIYCGVAPARSSHTPGGGVALAYRPAHAAFFKHNAPVLIHRGQL